MNDDGQEERPRSVIRAGTCEEVWFKQGEKKKCADDCAHSIQMSRQILLQTDEPYRGRGRGRGREDNTEKSSSELIGPTENEWPC